MALKVIGAGLGRTGTLSLKFALTQIGFGPCYHMMEVTTVPERIEHWNKAYAERATMNWDEVFDGFVATVDWPACNVYRELMAKYPDAKVILTQRPAEAWYASTQATIFGDVLAEHAPPFFKNMLGDIIGPDRHDKATVIANYERHNAEVRAYVPREKLLEFDPSMGWAPLCAFLGVPVPETPYPKVNSTDEFQAMIRARMEAVGVS